MRTPWDRSRAAALIAARREAPGAMLPILHELQACFGYIDDEAIPLIADALNLSKAETLGVVSFYHDFRRVAADGPVIKLCRAESCQAAGGDRLAEYLERAGAGVTVEAVYCLGHCALSPAALVDGEPVARLSEAKLDEILAAAKGRR